MIRILGLDYGKRRIGVALSDPLGMTAQPFETWNVRDWNSIILKISALTQKMNVGKIVMGLPLSLSGEKSSMTKEVEKFAIKLYNHIQIPVILVDERLTSVQSEHILRQMNIKYSKKKHKVDLLSAVLILQNYLDQQTEPTIRHVRDIS